ncbi:biopolymer transporter ExbD [Chromobacterium violaceum]|uniref:biopolymer transporter ExbD n=1 Tax=Chromobacterium violaceum TaxID=536 RepID=UPI0021753639|nr:biopolymer transporter ExbD [Chromobacterium violaceum]
MEAKLSAAGKSEPQPELHIKPNKDASYAPVAMVLAESQRLGLTKLGIVGSEQFVQ